MPIGKNSIKRVKNNGYSHVATSAPDMENSTVIASPAPEVIALVTPTAEKSATVTETAAPVPKKATGKKTKKTVKEVDDVKKTLPKKPSGKKGPARKAAKKETADKAAAPVKGADESVGAGSYVNLGGTPLPVHLL